VVLQAAAEAFGVISAVAHVSAEATVVASSAVAGPEWRVSVMGDDISMIAGSIEDLSE